MNDETLSQIRVHERVLRVDLWYPRVNPDSADTIEVGLMDVRAADSIQISYDFDRDGWVVKQDSLPNDGSEDWQEVAFVEAWAREVPKPEPVTS